MFEEMVMQVAPERRDYQVFYLKHASASWVAMKLEDYFEIDTTKKSSANNRFNYWYFGGGMQDSDKNESRRLSKRKNLKFITDIDTNTIVVQGADPSQVQILAQLIEL